MSDNNDKSRFAELALELFGAQATKDFIQKIWDSASDEVKKHLADAVITKMREAITNGDLKYKIESTVSTALTQMVAAAIEEQNVKTALEVAAKKKVQDSWQQIAEEASRDAIRRIGYDVAEKMKGAFR